MLSTEFNRRDEIGRDVPESELTSVARRPFCRCGTRRRDPNSMRPCSGIRANGGRGHGTGGTASIGEY